MAPREDSEITVGRDTKQWQWIEIGTEHQLNQVEGFAHFAWTA
jgi:hypothetical protein